MMTNQTIEQRDKGFFFVEDPTYTVPITLCSYWSCGFREEGFISIWPIRNFNIIPAMFS